MTGSETTDTTDGGGRRERLDRRYWRLWWANGINSVGDGVFVAALPLLAVTVTQDPRQISLIAAMTYLPWLLLSLPTGVLVDRHDRVTLMWICQLIQAVLVAGVAGAAAVGMVNIPLLATAAFLLGSAEVLITNAAQSALPRFVAPDLLQKANSNQQVAQYLGANTLGPPLGSFLFALMPALPFGLDGVSFVASATLLTRLPRHHVERTERRSAGHEMIEGLRWLAKHKLLRLLAFMLAVNTFCNQVGFATLVLYATKTLHVSPDEYGLMLLGVGVGGTIGGLVNARIAHSLGAIPALIMAYAANSMIYLAMGLAPSGTVLAILLGACGFAVTITNVVTVSLRQQIVPESLLGRVNSVYRMLGWGLMPLGSAVGGFVAARYGLRAPLLGAGGIRTIALILAFPALLAGARRLQRRP
ncbi:MAG TPA: MFS transporter [Amycolatopsis sp.]|nr:MFS transporter [Amycolatopsis sp.]